MRIEDLNKKLLYYISETKESSFDDILNKLVKCNRSNDSNNNSTNSDDKSDKEFISKRLKELIKTNELWLEDLDKLAINDANEEVKELLNKINSNKAY